MNNFTVALLGTILLTAPASGQTANQKQETLAYLTSLAVPNGGFRPARPGKDGISVPSVQSTLEALRATKYFGGPIENKEKHSRFVQSQFDKATGGFIDPSAGTMKATVAMTVTGVLAAVELGLPTQPFADAVVQYLGKNAETFEDIRMGAAAFEALQTRPSYAPAWLEKVNELRNASGSWGQGDGVPRETGGAVAMVLRLGGKIEKEGDVLKAMKDGQRKDGGFGQAGAIGSDLATSYRIVRSLRMLKEKPANVQAMRDFIASCRNPDGGYGVAPGQLSSASGTYFAGVILHWLDEK
jgi:hypothetical protein